MTIYCHQLNQRQTKRQLDLMAKLKTANLKEYSKNIKMVRLHVKAILDSLHSNLYLFLAYTNQTQSQQYLILYTLISICS